MAEVNKINLKALKENYMKKPEEEKKDNDEVEQVSSESVGGEPALESTGEQTSVETKKKHKLDDKELFSKYESFFKKEGEQIQEKLHKKSKKSGGSKTKKYVVNFFAGVALLQLIIIPGYFIYSGGDLESIKASLFDTKDKPDENNGNNSNNLTNTGGDDNQQVVDNQQVEEEIIKEKEKINIGGYIFDVDTETNTSGEKTYIYDGERYNNKYELRRGLEKEIKRLKREKLIELLLEEKKLQENLNNEDIISPIE